MSSATQDLVLTNKTLALLDYTCPVFSVAAGRTLTLSPAVLARGTNVSLSVQGAGAVVSAALTNDATGLIGACARDGTGTNTKYAAGSGGVVAGAAGVAAATAAGVSDTTGLANYDVAAAGTLGAGASFNTLRYTGAAGTVAGNYAANGLLNAGAGILTLSGGAAVGAGRELVLTSPDTTRRIDLTGRVSDGAGGASGVTVTGGGQVRLTASNDYSGVTAVSSGQLYVNNSGALGATNGSTVIYVNGSSATGGQLQLSGGITLAEPLTFVGVGDGDPWNSALTVVGGGGTNTLTGLISIPMGNGVRLTAGGAGTALNINGPIVRTGAGNTLILGAASGLLNVNYPINNNGGAINLHSGPGTVVFNVTNNNIGDMNVQWGHLLRLGVSDALAARGNLRVGDSNTQGGGSEKGTFDLSGFNQTVNALNGDGLASKSPPYTRVITNSAAGVSVFTVGNGDGSGTFNGLTGGNFALVKVGTGSQYFIATNAYTAGTTVNGGLLVLSNAVNHGALAVNGGTFRFPPSLTVNGALSGTGGTIDTLPEGDPLTVNQTTNTLFAGALIGNGALIKNGPGALSLYGANSYSGGTTVAAGMLVFGKTASKPAAGTVTVAAGAGLGLGLGGASGFSSADVDALWAGTLPGVTLDAASLVGIDTSYGDVTYATGQSTRGLVKTGTNTLTLSGVNTYTGGTLIQAGVLSIPTTAALPGWDLNGSYWVSRDAGLAVGNAVSDADFATIGATTNFAAFGCIGFDTTVSNRVYGGSIGNTVNGALGLVKVGTNTLTLTAASTYDGITYVNGGRLVIKNSSAFGSTNGYTVVNRVGGTNAWFTDSTGQVQLDGSGGALTVGENFIINGDQQYSYAGSLRSTAGNNAVNGWIIVGPSGRIGVDAGTLTLNGPIFRANATYNPMLVLSPNSAMIISNTIDIGTGLINFHSGGVATLCSTSNTWGSAQIQYGGNVKLGTNDAMAVGKQVWLGNNEPGNGKIDLFGYSQTLGGLQEFGTAASKLNNIVTNGRPEKVSTLTLSMGSGVTNLFGGRLCGTMDLVKSGAANSLMTLWGTNALSGKVTVSGGTLALGATGVLGAGCTNVTVSAGALMLQSSSALAGSVTVNLASGGGAKVSLSSGVNQSVAYLFVDGQMQRAGTYGSQNSQAANKSDTLFAGQGVLTVRLDNAGTQVLLK